MKNRGFGKHISKNDIISVLVVDFLHVVDENIVGFMFGFMGLS